MTNSNKNRVASWQADLLAISNFYVLLNNVPHDVRQALRNEEFTKTNDNVAYYYSSSDPFLQS